jgi:hypothetical protein
MQELSHSQLDFFLPRKRKQFCLQHRHQVLGREFVPREIAKPFKARLPSQLIVLDEFQPEPPEHHQIQVLEVLINYDNNKRDGESK